MKKLKKKVLKKINIKNVIAYIQGNIRYSFYYHPVLITCLRPHITEQIDMRIRSMNRECFENGECVKCGCKTTHLQMANKTCEGNCYPTMIKKSVWKGLKEYGNPCLYDAKTDTLWSLKDRCFTKID